MMTEYDTNQTQFAENQPLFQSVSVPEVATHHEDDAAQKKPSQKKKIIFIVSIVFGLIFLLLFLVLLLPKKPAEVSQVVASPSPSPVISADNPLRARVENLQTELDAADPQNQSLVFPPINMNIFLDKPEN